MHGLILEAWSRARRWLTLNTNMQQIRRFSGRAAVLAELRRGRSRHIAHHSHLELEADTFKTGNAGDPGRSCQGEESAGPTRARGWHADSQRFSAREGYSLLAHGRVTVTLPTIARWMLQ